MSNQHFDIKAAEELINPARRKKVQPEMVVELLALSGNEKIIDLGAGNGFFTLPIAESTMERVVAVDIQDEMLGMLDDRAKEQNIKNIDRMKSRVESLTFPDGQFQRAVAAFVLPEVDGIERTLREIKRVLSNEGQLLILEWEESESDDGPPMDQRIHSERMMKYIQDEGFHAQLGHLSGDIYYISAEK
ncbi:ubiquinone/menaquinone biosynthesis C-methylase UbiE [Salirhabdus euzebyi]|uniref:Ubiquinone/menaquinone biosynthesis C-methylase UbiE n=1 Tax=Salirhabdus euzebyi TaxID=394506 RepID=A0A841Q8R5_9BACI|nr:methyltransferase domain-containing protein [Salirhabdus euzebyi]MBB6454798.1 ubiquinone/menaquinone biosynthesis C-methylase UbiE [Salirhabdus euzebyi]